MEIEEIEDLDAEMSAVVGTSEQHGVGTLRALQASLMGSFYAERSGGSGASIGSVLAAAQAIFEEVEGDGIGGVGLGDFRKFMGRDPMSLPAGGAAEEPCHTPQKQRRSSGLGAPFSHVHTYVCMYVYIYIYICIDNT